MDLADLLAGISSHQGDDEPGLTDIQIATRLREAAALLAEKHEFRYGDIIQHKLGKQSSFRTGPKPIIFLGYLPNPVLARDLPVTEPSEVFTNAFSAELDCRVGILLDGRFNVTLAESCEYAPHPDFPSH